MEVAATGAAAEAIGRHVPQLVADRVASRLFDRDATLWGPDAEPEAGVRLGWVGLHRSSRPLLGQIAALRDELLEQGLDHVVLCGMGGSSLAPEVICAAAGVELTVLDSSEPGQVAAALGDRLEHTVVVVSSKSGSTVETDSQRRAYVAAFEDAGLDPTRHLVVVTDPGSPLDEQSRADGYRVVNADPNVGGRYSALTAFGLVPSGLAGADVEELLDDAEAVADLLAEDDEGNPALRLAAAMAGTDPLRDKLVLVEEESGLPGFPDWAEQLIAESTGKDGTGVLPVVVGSTADPEVALPPPDDTDSDTGSDAGSDTGSDADADPGSDPDAGTEPNTEPDSGAAGEVAGDRSGAAGEGGPATATSPVVTATATGSEVAVSGSLGAQLLLWETATAVAGRLLGINPFDQPDVESAKKAARSLLEGSPDEAEPDAVDGPLEIRTLGPGWAGEVASLADAVDALLSQVDPDRGYLAVMAYLDRIVHADLADVRRTLAIRTRRPVTFGWGPRFLHSTGQFHKGGPAVGVFLQVTAEPVRDLSVPGRDFTFGRLVAAQAAGDARVLAEHGRPVLRLHLRDVAGGQEMLRKALA